MSTIEPLFPLPEPVASSTPTLKGQPRLATANREQVELRYTALNDLLPEDHRARLV
jgi:hypothetical protein